jgi:hypothetical protein
MAPKAGAQGWKSHRTQQHAHTSFSFSFSFFSLTLHPQNNFFLSCCLSVSRDLFSYNRMKYNRGGRKRETFPVPHTENGSKDS